MELGTILLWERVFTLEDVLKFGELTGDQGAHHVIPDEQGRLMVQGLLTASLPTKIGGDHHYITRTCEYEFLRPVFTGDLIRCEVRVVEYTPAEGKIHVTSLCTCTNQHGKTVLTGSFHGIILT